MQPTLENFVTERTQVSFRSFQTCKTKYKFYLSW